MANLTLNRGKKKSRVSQSIKRQEIPFFFLNPVVGAAYSSIRPKKLYQPHILHMSNQACVGKQESNSNIILGKIIYCSRMFSAYICNIKFNDD